jgi:hypothetical protein
MCEIVCGRKSTCMAQTKIYRHKKDINIELQPLHGNSTDDNVTGQETKFIRTCVQGKTITRFVCIGKHQSTSSEDLFAFVNKKLN